MSQIADDAVLDYTVGKLTVFVLCDDTVSGIRWAFDWLNFVFDDPVLAIAITWPRAFETH